ncbi:MAG: glycosyltransferase family 4 protein [Candidatus Saccharicenans sp.]
MSLCLAAGNPQEGMDLKQIFFIAQELKKKKTRFFILTSPGSDLYNQAKLWGFPVIGYKLDGSSRWLSTWKLCRLMKKNRISLIHFFDELALNSGVKASQKAGTAVRVASARSDFLKKVPANYLKSLDSLICSSEEVKKFLLKNNLSVAGIEVIPPGIDFSRYQDRQKKNWLSKELGFSADEVVVGLITPLDDLKTLRSYFEAFRLLEKQAPKVKIVILGQGELHLEQLRHEFPVEMSNLYFYLGFLEKREEIFSSLDLFIFGAFSLPEDYLLEAMVWKVPIIGVMAAGRSDLLIHRETGYLVPPNDPAALAQAVIKLYLDRALSLELSEQAYNLVFNKHSGEAMAQKMVDFYEFLALQKGVKLAREGHYT